LRTELKEPVRTAYKAVAVMEKARVKMVDTWIGTLVRVVTGVGSGE